MKKQIGLAGFFRRIFVIPHLMRNPVFFLDSRFRGNDAYRNRIHYGITILILSVLVTCHFSLVTAAEWGGVDESVVEKYAKEHGREAREPLINTDQGDLLLFVFLLAGAIGGFAAGYYWRVLTENRAESSKNRTNTYEPLAQKKE